MRIKERVNRPQSVRFDFGGDEYSYITVNDWMESDWDLSGIAPIGKTKVLNIGLAFDIETCKIGVYSHMYVWQFAIDDITVIGRTWESFVTFLEDLSCRLKLGKDRKAYIWVHHLSFEFSFLKHWLQWERDKKGRVKIFAISNTKIVTANAYGFQFRDSLILTQRKLAKVATDFETGINKLEETLNYDLNMSKRTPLKLCQLAYCINDVQILQRWYHKYVVPTFLRKGIKVPLTATGIVRNDLRKKFNSLPQEERDAWRREVRRGYPSREDYEVIMEYLFRGGYVHAESVYSGILETTPMGSDDLKSSYPAQALQHNYPRRFVIRKPEYFDEIKNDRKWQETHAFYGCFKISGITNKTCHTLESVNKIYDHEGHLILDNGRLARTDPDGSITVLLTEIDWQLYQKFYNMQKVECLALRIADKHPLPEWFKDLILEYFATKETMPKDTLEYRLAKSNANSIYGMTVTSIYDKTLQYDDETGQFDVVDKNKLWQDLISKEILLPWFGIWITAYGRQDVCNALLKLGYDGRYGDTDSCKYTNIIGNAYIFKDHNDRIMRINKRMYVGDHDRRLFLKLGCFEHENKSYLFETNGAKRYIHTDIVRCKDGKYRLEDVVTIAGLPKGSLQSRAERDDAFIYDLFTDKMTLSELDSDKLSTHYEHQPFTVESVDYLGEAYTEHERSCVTLVPITFKMSLAKDYVKYRLEERNKMIVGRRMTT